MLSGADISTQDRHRLGVIVGVIAVAFVLLSLKLYSLQVLQHEQLRSRSEQNAMTNSFAWRKTSSEYRVLPIDTAIIGGLSSACP